MSKFVNAAMALSAVLAVIGPAKAEEAQMRVKVSDLNVASMEGARAALARVRFSAAAFCDASAGRQSLEHDAAVARCVAEMTRKGVDGLHAPLVTALMHGRQVVDQPTQVALAQ